MWPGPSSVRKWIANSLSYIPMSATPVPGMFGPSVTERPFAMALLASNVKAASEAKMVRPPSLIAAAPKAMAASGVGSPCRIQQVCKPLEGVGAFAFHGQPC